MSDKIVRFDIEIDTKTGEAKLAGFGKVVDDTAKKAKKGAADIEDGTKKLTASFTNLQSIIGTLVAFQGFRFLANSVREFADAEASSFRLEMAFRNQGDASGVAAAAASEFADEMERLSGVDGDVIRAGQSLLVSLGNLSGDGLERGTKAALDLAAGLSIDVNTAFTMISKAAAGSTGALGRYGIQVAANATNDQKYNQVLDQVQKKWGGLAEEFGNTLPGQMLKAQTAWGNFKEAVGQAAVSSGGVEFLNAMTFAVDKLSQKLREFSTGVPEDPAERLGLAFERARVPIGQTEMSLDGLSGATTDYNIDVDTLRAGLDVVGPKMENLTYQYDRNYKGVGFLADAHARAQPILDEWFKGLMDKPPKAAKEIYSLEVALRNWIETAKRGQVDVNLNKLLGFNDKGEFPSLPRGDLGWTAKITNPFAEVQGGATDLDNVLARLQKRLDSIPPQYGALIAFTTPAAAAFDTLRESTQGWSDALMQAAGVALFAAMSGEGSTKKILKAVLTQIGQEASVKALMEFAEAIAAYARYDPVAGSAHLQAGGMFLGVAAAAAIGSRLAGGGGGGGKGGGGKPNSKGGGGTTPAPVPTPAAAAPHETVVNVVITGQGFIQNYETFARELGDQLTKELRSSGR